MIARRAALGLLGCAAARFALAQERCGAGRDLMVRALERIGPKYAPSDVEDALQLLKHSTDLCPDSGDAWYYRSLVEKKLGHAPLADFALRKAKLIGSDALQQAADPFTPATRVEKAVPDNTPVRAKWALVIGIGQFKDKSISPLRYTTKDARDFAAALQDPACGRFSADHVRLVTDEQATTVKIKSELNWLARNAAKDDLTVVFLSSHGSSREMDTAGVNYVVTHDTDVTDQDSLFATALPMVEFADVVRTRVMAHRAAIFLDTCHSGAAVANAASPSGANLERLRQGVGRTIITSSQVSERSWESDRFQNGYFTHFLLEALRRDGGRGSLTKIYDYLREKVPAQVAADVKAKQNPVLSRSDAGVEIVLGV